MGNTPIWVNQIKFVGEAYNHGCKQYYLDNLINAKQLFLQALYLLEKNKETSNEHLIRNYEIQKYQIIKFLTYIELGTNPRAMTLEELKKSLHYAVDAYKLSRKYSSLNGGFFGEAEKNIDYIYHIFMNNYMEILKQWILAMPHLDCEDSLEKMLTDGDLASNTSINYIKIRIYMKKYINGNLSDIELKDLEEKIKDCLKNTHGFSWFGVEMCHKERQMLIYEKFGYEMGLSIDEVNLQEVLLMSDKLKVENNRWLVCTMRQKMAFYCIIKELMTTWIPPKEYEKPDQNLMITIGVNPCSSDDYSLKYYND